MHSIQNNCQAGFYDGELIESIFEAPWLHPKLLDCFPSFDLGFDLEIVGQGQNGLNFRVCAAKLYPSTNLLPT